MQYDELIFIGHLNLSSQLRTLLQATTPKRFILLFSLFFTTTDFHIWTMVFISSSPVVCTESIDDQFFNMKNMKESRSIIFCLCIILYYLCWVLPHTFIIKPKLHPVASDRVVSSRNGKSSLLGLAKPSTLLGLFGGLPIRHHGPGLGVRRLFFTICKKKCLFLFLSIRQQPLGLLSVR